MEEQSHSKFREEFEKQLPESIKQEINATLQVYHALFNLMEPAIRAGVPKGDIVVTILHTLDTFAELATTGTPLERAKYVALQNLKNAILDGVAQKLQDEGGAENKKLQLI